MSVQQRKNVSYGLSDALLAVPNFPIVSERAPSANDLAEIGTLWIDKPNNDAYILTSIVAAQGTWSSIIGSGGSFTALDVQGTADINAIGGAATNIGTGTGQVTIGNATTDVDIANNIAVFGDATVAGNVSTQGTFICSTAGAGVLLGAAGGTGAQLLCGSGDPDTVVTANKGSLYMRLDGSSSSTRAYINIDGVTAWTNLVTAA